jgi:hypothetical protein
MLSPTFSMGSMGNAELGAPIRIHFRESGRDYDLDGADVMAALAGRELD